MKRAVVVLLTAVMFLASVQPADAYTHIAAPTNVRVSVAWSGALFPSGAMTAILVRSDGFADSLAAGALAGSIGAPVLMNPPGGGLDPYIDNELARLSVERVEVIGGTAAVSAQTVTELEAAGYEVVRHAGENRLATAADVKADAFPGASVAYLARAFGTGTAAFADSLGAGMLAGTSDAPLLLTATESLSPETEAALTGVGTVVIVGGTAAVSDAVQDRLVAMGITVRRIAGVDRFATAALVAEESYDAANSGLVAIVDGFHADSWASGFAASAAAGGAVLLSYGDELSVPTVETLQAFDATATTDDLYCAPQVGHNACLEAEELLNG